VIEPALEDFLNDEASRGTPRGAAAIFSDAEASVYNDEEPAKLEPNNGGQRLLAMAAALVVLAVGAVGLASLNDDDGSVGTGSDTSAAPGVEADDLAWLTVHGDDLGSPPLPNGWKRLDHADLGFAVPEGWEEFASGCGDWSPQAQGSLVVLPATAPSLCREGTDRPASVLEISRGGAVSRGPTQRVAVGVLEAMVALEPACAECATYLFDDGLKLSISGPNADQIRASFGDSGARRALQNGEVAETNGWQSIEYAGVSFNVPLDWPYEDLIGSFVESFDAEGRRVGVSGSLNPGACSGIYFEQDAPHVALGESPITPRCPWSGSLDLGQADGVWLRERSFQTDPVGEVASGSIGGLSVSVVDLGRPQLDLFLGEGSKRLHMSLGIGEDPSIARAILRSLKSSGNVQIGSGPEVSTNLGSDGGADATVGEPPAPVASSDSSASSEPPNTAAPGTDAPSPVKTFVVDGVTVQVRTPLDELPDVATRVAITPSLLLDEGQGPQVCFGGTDSVPPQCSGPLLLGVDIADMEGVQEGGDTRWVEEPATRFVGNWNGADITVTSRSPSAGASPTVNSRPPTPPAGYSESDLRAIQSRLNQLRGEYGGSSAVSGGWVWINLDVVDGDTARAFAAELDDASPVLIRASAEILG
jgi:hypothetical protein